VGNRSEAWEILRYYSYREKYDCSQAIGCTHATGTTVTGRITVKISLLTHAIFTIVTCEATFLYPVPRDTQDGKHLLLRLLAVRCTVPRIAMDVMLQLLIRRSMDYIGSGHSVFRMARGLEGRMKRYAEKPGMNVLAIPNACLWKKGHVSI
jgi:hypothetical protein